MAVALKDIADEEELLVKYYDAPFEASRTITGEIQPPFPAPPEIASSCGLHSEAGKSLTISL
jgi:hypothetical protein